MKLYQDLVHKREKISVVGLGYVGLPIAVAFAKKMDVIGFDTNEDKINKYNNGEDPTNEVGEEIKQTTVKFTSDETLLKKAKFHVVAVPTPINKNHTPDLIPLEEASKLVGRNLSVGSVVVFESTVFPGVTEDICIPLLEKESGLKAGIEFKVGYSPERINPGDRVNRLETIIKIVSGMDEEALEVISKVYETIIEAGIHKAPTIKVAEAAKVIENAQRDVNIAFMNELAMIFNQLDINTQSVLEAASTKWNFLKFYPGLVGGHCIGVDPYYLTYKAEQEGYHSRIILAGRQINDDMGSFIVENIIKQSIAADIHLKNARIAVLGFSFKEDIPDVRNSRVIDIVDELKDYGISPIVVDPVVDKAEVKNEYGITIESMDALNNLDVIVVAVSHQQFLALSEKEIASFYRKDKTNNYKVLIDVKGIFNSEEYINLGYRYWSL